MLISESSVSENLHHVWLPLAEQASRKILQKLGLDEYFANNIFINSDYSGSSVSWKDKQTRYAMLNEQKFHVNVKFNNNTLNLKWDTTSVAQHMDTMVHRRDTIPNKPLFFDKETGIHIIEREVPANIEMECQMVFNDSTVAFDAVTAFTNTFNRGELMECINLSYDYQMPVSILKDLWILGQMKGLKKGEFVEWFAKCSDNRIQWIESKRQNNLHHELVIKKHVYEALMSIDYNPDQPAIESKGTAAEAVVVPFNLTLQVSRANMIYLKYPIVVNNTMVPEQLVHFADDDLNLNLYKTLCHPNPSLNWMYQHTMHLEVHPLHMPWYDNWVIPQGSQLYNNNSFAMLTVAFTFDDEECKCCHKACCTCDCTAANTVLDLYSLDGYKLSDRFKTWLLENKDIALDVDSPFSVSVYADNVQITPSKIEFDGRYLKIPNRFRHEGVYRVVFARRKVNLPKAYPWLWILDCFIITNKED